MTKAVEALKTRLSKLKSRLEEYEMRHQEKCLPLQTECNKLLQMIAIGEPEHEQRVEDQTGE